jgi:hypothetical protein
MEPVEKADDSPLLGIYLAAAMFVFVIDTSFMNVSISAVVHDLDTTVSGVQARWRSRRWCPQPSF